MNKEVLKDGFHWDLAWAVQAACILEADAPKVGNVNRYHDFSDCSLEDFHLSALALGRPFGFMGRQGVGETIFQAISATRKHVDTNTNLGMVLLLAPLGMAWSLLREDPSFNRPDQVSLLELWKQKLRLVLEGLTREDTDYVYRAIRLAAPAGMGEVREYDVLQDQFPEITLLEVMKLAAERDLIARQYSNNFDQVLDVGYPALQRFLDEHLSLPQAIAQTHLFLLSQYPDSLITRKLGPEWSGEVQKRAGAVWKRGGWRTITGREFLLRFDRWLRKDGHRLNPGTTADLMAAIIFVLLLVKKWGDGEALMR
ncbi:triphosphoribosyl-dephospho-CoA synthase [Candidatus Formimonas warabiya]|uniref:Uncharacterized protein n=1 Tax=Formimonas warabiya TaxID=1761012 RepID=A0A3G1KNL1_FORW1|nr:triphosphoribosyl-dephospho-CoA synthase [Candidatus Formimonas warabiya]ATW24048.1 hypothetical protein DCMF_03925 [Candidatus Formimonas warabiya]